MLFRSDFEKVYAIDPWEYNPELANPEECYETCKLFLSGFGVGILIGLMF